MKIDLTSTCRYRWRIFFLLFFEKKFGGHKSFYGATDTPVLDFWWHLFWVTKSGWIPLLACFVTCMQWIPQIYLWCDTYWPLSGQHGTWAISSMHWHTSIGGARVQDQAYPCLTACDKRILIFWYSDRKVEVLSRFSRIARLKYAIQAIGWLVAKINVSVDPIMDWCYLKRKLCSKNSEQGITNCLKSPLSVQDNCQARTTSHDN